MSRSPLDGATIAQLDQTRAEAADWAKTLIEFRGALCQGGFSSRQAYRLSALWFREQLCHHLGWQLFDGDEV